MNKSSMRSSWRIAWIAALLSAGTSPLFGQWNGGWICAAPSTGIAAPGGGVPDSHPGQNPAQNVWQCFRNTFDLSVKPSTAIARIAVDSKYWLWVNGRLVVFEGGLKRGPNPQDTYYDQVDIAKYLSCRDATLSPR